MEKYISEGWEHISVTGLILLTSVCEYYDSESIVQFGVALHSASPRLPVRIEPCFFQ